jgi:hypothetical protein
VIKSYSPELIVHPYLPDSNGEDDQQVVSPAFMALRDMDCRRLCPDITPSSRLIRGQDLAVVRNFRNGGRIRRRPT